MDTMPDRCRNLNSASSFCGCIAEVEPVDPAVKGFCARVKSGSDKNALGDELVELKKALMDLESRP